MENGKLKSIKKFFKFLEFFLLILSAIFIIGSIIYIGKMEKNEESFNSIKIETKFISDEVKKALIISYYEYILENNDTNELKKFNDIKNSRVTMP